MSRHRQAGPNHRRGVCIAVGPAPGLEDRQLVRHTGLYIYIHTPHRRFSQRCSVIATRRYKYLVPLNGLVCRYGGASGTYFGLVHLIYMI